jgi:hypothetical protein
LRAEELADDDVIIDEAARVPEQPAHLLDGTLAVEAVTLVVVLGWTERALAAVADERLLAIVALDGRILKDPNLTHAPVLWPPGIELTRRNDRSGRPAGAGPRPSSLDQTVSARLALTKSTICG